MLEAKKDWEMTEAMRKLVTEKEFVEGFEAIKEGKHGDAVITKKNVSSSSSSSS